MAAPVRGSTQPIQTQGAEGVISGGRHYEANPPSARYIEALGLSELLAQDPLLASSRNLTEAELAAGPLAKPLYRANMSISERIQTLSLVEKYGEYFVNTIAPLVWNWEEGSDCYSFYEQVAKDPTKWSAIRQFVYPTIEKTRMIELITVVQSCCNEHLEGAPHLFLQEDTPIIKTQLLTLLSGGKRYDLESFQAFAKLPLCYRMGKAGSRISKLFILNRVNKESRQALAELINSNPDYHHLLSPLSRLNASDWQSYIDQARIILPEGNLKKIVELLVDAKSPSVLIDLFHFCAQPDQTSEQRFALFESLTKLPPKTYEVVRFIAGPGTTEEARLIVTKILHSEQRSYLIDLFRNLISRQTPLAPILSLIKLLEAHIPWKSALRHFFRETTCKDRKQHVDLEHGREMEQLSELLCLVSSRELIFGDRETLQRAVFQMKAYFASILENQVLESASPSAEQIEKATQFGQMLALLIENGLKLPSDIAVGEFFFDNLDRGPLTEIIEKKLSQEGLWKVSRVFGELLTHQPLPQLPHLRTISPATSRISEDCRKKALSEFKKELQSGVLSLFRDDEDYASADEDVKKFIKSRDFPWNILKTAPLFLQRDDAKQKIELMKATTPLTHQQIANTSCLIREGDSVETRIALARGIRFSRPLCQSLPLLLSDTAEMRLQVRNYIETNQCQSAATVFPPTLAIDIERRCSMLLYFKQLKIAEFEPPIYENFIRFMMESEEDARLRDLQQLRRLSSEVLRELFSIDYERLNEIFSFIRQLKDTVPKLMLNQVAINAMNSDCALFSRCFYTFLSSDSAKTKATLFLLLKRISCQEECILFLRDYGEQMGRAEIIHALYQIDPSTVGPLLEQLSTFRPFQTIYKFVDFNPNERRILLERLARFLNQEDNMDGRNALFELLCNMPLDSHQAVLSLLQESLNPNDDGEQRRRIFSLVAGCEAVPDFEQILAAHYRSSTEDRFDAHERIEIPIDLKQLKLPQLFPHLQKPIQYKPKMIIEGDLGQDEGGLSRQILTDASHEIPHFYPFFAKNLEGTFSIHRDAELTDEEREKALSLGNLFLLMSMLGVTMPVEAPLDPLFFYEISYYPQALLKHETIEELLRGCRQNFEALQDLYRIFHRYQIDKFGIEAFPILEKRERDDQELSEDHAMLLEGIHSKELHFCIARGLSMGGSLPCLPITGRLLTFRGNLREILTDKSTWEFDIQGDAPLLIDYFMQWLNQCSDRELADFVFSMRGTAHMPFGQKLRIETGNVRGPSLHTCFDLMEMPRIPLESELIHIQERIEAEKSRLGELPARLEALLQEHENALRQLRSTNPTNHQLTELAESHALAREPLEREMERLQRLERLEVLASLRNYPSFKTLMDGLPRTNSHA